MKVLTAAVNSPLFIELQYYSLQKYLQNEYEFIVFNNATKFPHFTNNGDLELYDKINDICKELNIKCIIVEDKIKEYNYDSSADVHNIMTEYMITNPDEYLVLDSDMFLINYLDINKYANSKCAVVIQERNNLSIKYMWNGLHYFNIHKMDKLELIRWNRLPNTDVGGETSKWFKEVCNYDNIPKCIDLRNNVNNNINYIIDNIYYIKHLWSLSWNSTEIPPFLNDTKILEYIQNDPRNINGKYFCEIYDNTFLHFRAGSNWMKKGLYLDLRIKLKNALL